MSCRDTEPFRDPGSEHGQAVRLGQEGGWTSHTELECQAGPLGLCLEAMGKPWEVSFEGGLAGCIFGKMGQRANRRRPGHKECLLVLRGPKVWKLKQLIQSVVGQAFIECLVNADYSWPLNNMGVRGTILPHNYLHVTTIYPPYMWLSNHGVDP